MYICPNCKYQTGSSDPFCCLCGSKMELTPDKTSWFWLIGLVSFVLAIPVTILATFLDITENLTIVFFATCLIPPFSYLIIRAIYNKKKTGGFLGYELPLPAESISETGYSICPLCKNEPEKGEVFCSKCGSKLVPLPPKKMSKYWLPWFGMLGLGIVFSFILPSISGDIGLPLFMISFLTLIVSFFVYAARRWRWMRENWWRVLVGLALIGGGGGAGTRRFAENNSAEHEKAKQEADWIKYLQETNYPSAPRHKLPKNTLTIQNSPKDAEHDKASAQYKLGQPFETEEDYINAVIHYYKAAAQGNAEAQCCLGICYYVNQNYDEAIKWYRKAAEQGDAVAQCLLGDCFFGGTGISRNYAEAFKWYRKAAEQGFDLAQVALGDCYFLGMGVEPDKKEAYRWVRMAAEQGFALGQNNLGSYYQNGVGVEKNEKEALKWFRKAAEQGLTLAQYNLGFCYLDGLGVEENHHEAVKWFRKAAEQEKSESIFPVSFVYHIQEDGSGQKMDYSEALKRQRNAVDQGITYAQVALGACYMEGIGVEKDENEAVKWFRKAAEQGFDLAQVALGNCYYHGIGVEKDENEAVKWLRLAVEQGNENAKNTLKQLGID